jgi:hypothetical protein
MEAAGQSPLTAWHDFYVIVGSSGAALTGLQFVVIALIADSKRQSTTREIETFGTPTIVHFSTVLLISAILSAPWQALSNAALALDACGLMGVIYGAVILRRAYRLKTYRLIAEEWVWYLVLPLIGYASLLISAVTLPGHPQTVSFLIAAIALLFLFIGIHNAWDTVTFIATGEFDKHEPEKPPEAK